jgi:RNA polymerase sigma-70 factor (ECF subfamily)
MLFSSTDNDLIGRALDGSQRAWVTLVERHERQVYNFCLRQTRNPSDAMDLLQDVFLAVYRHLPSWRSEGEFPAWIMRIAVNKTMDLYRQRQRSPQTDTDEHAEAAVLDWQAPTSHEPAYMHEQLSTNADIVRQLQTLPIEQRLVVEMKFFQHRTFEQISKLTGVPVNTVKSRLYASLQKLKDHLEASHAL